MRLAETVLGIDNRQRRMETDFAQHQEFTKNMFEQNKRMLDLILEQTRKTNGNTTKNTDSINTLNLWRSKTRGIWFAIVVIAVSISTVASLVVVLYAK